MATMRQRTVHHPAIAQELRGLREAKGWTQTQASQIAERRNLQVSYAALRGLEDGTTRCPSAELLRNVERLYEIEPDGLVSRFIDALFPGALDLLRQGSGVYGEGYREPPDDTHPVKARLLVEEAKRELPHIIDLAAAVYGATVAALARLEGRDPGSHEAGNDPAAGGGR